MQFILAVTLPGLTGRVCIGSYLLEIHMKQQKAKRMTLVSNFTTSKYSAFI